MAAPILLEYQHAWPLRIVRVILDNNTGSNATDYLSR